ncbi:MAG: hypothetical protein GY769_19010 [bacterium]|nr:hypothetical protein [bacterium]
MTENRISLTDALSDAWDRMKTILFRPFDLKKWMVLGFTAWLAGLAQGGQSFSWNVGGGADSSESEVWASGGSEAMPASARLETRTDWPDWDHWVQWLLEHPFWFAAGVFGCLFLLTLLVVILWLSSRGKFMFLDNVVHDRAEVVRPWNRYRRLGNSHFGFQLAFYGLFMVIVLGAVLLVIAITSGSGMTFGAPGAGLGLIVLLPGVVLVVLIAAYIQYFLDGFVVPLMYRYDLRVLDAWSRFGELFRRHPWALLLSGMFLLLLGLAAMVVVVVAGLLTCCIGLLLVIIPYIGTVVLLPIPVTYRGFTVALLDQMDPGYFPDQRTSGDRPLL